MHLRTAQMCFWYWTDYHWLSTVRISSDDKVICCSAKSRSSESWMWLGTKDVALKICSSYSELKELTQKIILSSIWQFMVSHKLIQCSNRKFNPRNWRNVKTHNLISGIKSEDTYGYVPDYTKPLTCIGCHIGFIFVRSGRVWLNIPLDFKYPRYRHQTCLPMLLCSKTTGYLIFWRLW